MATKSKASSTETPKTSVKAAAGGQTAAKKAAAKKTGVEKPAAPTSKKTAAKPPAAKKPVGAKKAAPEATVTRGVVRREVSEDQRRHYIEVAAYYIAERRGFVGGSPEEDWKAAEAEIDRLLAEGKLNG